MPLLILCLDSGMRSFEVQALLHGDLRLTWENGDKAGSEVIVAKSNKAAGTWRLIPLSRPTENPNTSKQTIRALAGQATRQMLERYSHIRLQAKQAAFGRLEGHENEPILEQTGHKIGQPARDGEASKGANSLETDGRPARI